MRKTKKYGIDGKQILFNIMLLLLMFMVFNILTSQIFGKKEFNTISLTVKSGDTIWNISKNICKKNTSLNIQEVIYDIKEINGLEGSIINEGDILKIPVY